jgi:hypothetical protein
MNVCAADVPRFQGKKDPLQELCKGVVNVQNASRNLAVFLAI